MKISKKIMTAQAINDSITTLVKFTLTDLFLIYLRTDVLAKAIMVLIPYEWAEAHSNEPKNFILSDRLMISD